MIFNFVTFCTVISFFYSYDDYFSLKASQITIEDIFKNARFLSNSCDDLLGKTYTVYCSQDNLLMYSTRVLNLNELYSTYESQLTFPVRNFLKSSATGTSGLFLTVHDNAHCQKMHPFPQ
jgi:hypothetical protein